MWQNFNPRSPCGERQPLRGTWEWILRFQSTLPLWGATLLTHSSETEASYFNPRSPCGERPELQNILYTLKYDFNPRSPCGERHDWDSDGGVT